MKNKPTKSNSVFLRLDDNTYAQLLDLCTAYDVTPQQFLIAEIQQAYDKFNNNPALREMLRVLNSLTANLREQTQQVLEHEPILQTSGKQ